VSVVRTITDGRSGPLLALVGGGLLLAAAPSRGADGPPQVAVRLELTDGTTAAGDLAAIDEATVRLRSDAAEQAFSLERVRRVLREPVVAAPPRTVLVVTADGGRLAGDDFLVDGDRAVIALGDDASELPLARVRTVAWRTADRREPAWLAEIPERPAADLVVVRREEGQAFVDCAVVGVSPASVTVVLDGETIPVRREKVLGIVWLRERGDATGGSVVSLAEGRLTADRIGWSADGLILDTDTRLPAGSFEMIDFAAGRSVALADLVPERSEVEPFFGSLLKIEGLAAFFAVRSVGDQPGGGRGTLVIRPRSVTTWRVPADSRRFHATLDRESPADAALVEVAFELDGREIFRRRLGGPSTGEAADSLGVELDVSGGRRLTIAVDFVVGSLGCGVRLSEGAFEK
jgi:hypothetical protein